MDTTPKLESIVRLILTFLGAFIMGGGIHYIFGHVIDAAYWEEITGAVLAAFSIIWGFVEKDVNEEKWASALRQLVTFILAIMTAHNLLTAAQGLAVATFIGSMLPFILSWLHKVLNKKVAAGEVKFGELNGVEKKDTAKNPYIEENRS